LRSQKRLLQQKAEQLNSMIFCINRAIIECEQNNYSAKSTIDAMNIIFKAKRYDDDFALMKRFNRTPLEWNRWIYEQSDIAENMSVLDAGSGIGYLWRAAANELPCGVKITCLDRRNTNADLFYDDIHSGRLKINAEFEFVWANMEQYELTRQYDRIFLNHVISFIENPSALLYKFKSALKLNGIFICTWGDDTLRKGISELLYGIDPLKSTLKSVCDKSKAVLNEREELLNTVFDDVERRVFVTDCTFSSADECYSFIVRQFSPYEAVFEKCRPQIIGTIQNNMTYGKISLKKNTLLYRCR
ncbi:MAG: class I SAM-dependent methyltransferase, partial [Acutalibacteraceae bacterium]